MGGKIGGNTNVAGGRAKVILNEINSNAATTLNGMIEVAGGKAQVIVANASELHVTTVALSTPIVQH
ncbi:filamentous hemagglutinin N-terminal domain-containing protein [Providencia rettgeri]|nr:filamentous hemagglutinin N-terminal domain-containing protein [Providencia rettgeri]